MVIVLRHPTIRPTKLDIVGNMAMKYPLNYHPCWLIFPLIFYDLLFQEVVTYQIVVFLSHYINPIYHLPIKLLVRFLGINNIYISIVSTMLLIT